MQMEGVPVAAGLFQSAAVAAQQPHPSVALYQPQQQQQLPFGFFAGFRPPMGRPTANLAPNEQFMPVRAQFLPHSRGPPGYIGGLPPSLGFSAGPVQPVTLYTVLLSHQSELALTNWAVFV